MSRIIRTTPYLGLRVLDNMTDDAVYNLDMIDRQATMVVPGSDYISGNKEYVEDEVIITITNYEQYIVYNKITVDGTITIELNGKLVII